MPVCTNAERPRHWPGRWLLLWLALWAGALPGQSGEFLIQSARSRLHDNVYRLDAEISYRLSHEAIDALINGVSLTLVLNIDVTRSRWYLWDESVATLRQRYQLKYHLLSRQYLVTWQNTGVQENFGNLNTALQHLGTLADFPLLDAHLVDHGETYQVQLQTWLDIEALPAPLRPVAYFSSQWRLTSNRYTCPLETSETS